jgi:chromosome segregation ATPase
MSLEKMETLEVRVRGLVELVQELKQANESLQEQLNLVQEELSRQEAVAREWEEERVNIKLRIEKVLGQLDSLETSEAGLQEAVHD